MTDRPIIFSGPMVRALLDGRKTQTRRLATSPLRRCEVGDRLYVREEWKIGSKYDQTKPSLLEPRAMTILFGAGGSIANDEFGWRPSDHPGVGKLPDWAGRRRPGMHMPRWASRLTLIVEAVRTESVQSITEHDAWAEGVCVAIEGSQRATFGGSCSNEMRRMIVTSIIGGGAPAFHWLWDSLRKAEGERWEDNPDVAALTFRVVRGNIDQVPA